MACSIPPLEATTPTGPAGTSPAPGTKLATRWRGGARKPDVFGPRSRIPVTATTSESWASTPAPDSPASRKPPAHTTPARTPAAAASATAGAVAPAGTQKRARSAGWPVSATASATLAYTPAEGSGLREFTSSTGPGNEASERAMAAPSLPGSAEAPTTTTPAGAKRGDSAELIGDGVIRGFSRFRPRPP